MLRVYDFIKVGLLCNGLNLARVPLFQSLYIPGGQGLSNKHCTKMSRNMEQLINEFTPHLYLLARPHWALVRPIPRASAGKQSSIHSDVVPHGL